MIKVTINGFDVEVSSVEELRQLISRPIPTNAVLHAGNSPVVRVKRKYRRHTKSVWTPDEVKNVIYLLRNGVATSVITRNSDLRARHSRQSILNYLYKIRNYGKSNFSLTVSRNVKSLIEDYSQGTNRVPIRTA